MTKELGVALIALPFVEIGRDLYKVLPPGIVLAEQREGKVIKPVRIKAFTFDDEKNQLLMSRDDGPVAWEQFGSLYYSQTLGLAGQFSTTLDH